MIRLTDASLLALTKLRARRIRLIITIVISSLLLGVLAFGLFVTGGIFKSIDNFSHQGLNDRYLVSVSPTESWEGIDTNSTVIARANDLHVQNLAAKVAAAKKLGLPYNAKEEDGVFMPAYYEGGPTYLNFGNSAVQQAIREFFDSVPYNKSVIESLKQKYGAIAAYPFKVYYGFELHEMKNGVEKFGESPSPSVDSPEKFPYAIHGLDDSLTRPFEFDQATIAKNKPEGASMPVIVPYSYAEKLAGFEKLPATASSKQKLERIQAVRKQAPSLHPVACYRNQASHQLIGLALNYNKEAAKNKDNKDYVPPDLAYGLPDQASCGPATVIRDKRSAAVKQIEKQQKDVSIAGSTPEEIDALEPEQYKVTFQIVGIAPDAPTSNEGLSLTRLISAVAGSNLNNAWIVPDHLRVNTGSLLSSYTLKDDHIQETYLFEFASASAAKKFLDEFKCPLSNCKSPKRDFTLQQMGSNSIIVSQLRGSTTQGLLIVGAAVIFLAALVMMGNVGRMITDSRRETAVFRAIGAKRIDVTVIYVIYIAMVALLICVVGYLIGLGAALYGNYVYGGEATALALLNFGTSDMDRTFYLLDIRFIDFAIIAGLSLLAALIGSIIPLARNIRRNPIRDMRDE